MSVRVERAARQEAAATAMKMPQAGVEFELEAPDPGRGQPALR